MSRSPHILSTASNLLGFCLIVLTSIKVFGKAVNTIIDAVLVAANMQKRKVHRFADPRNIIKKDRREMA